MSPVKGRSPEDEQLRQEFAEDVIRLKTRFRQDKKGFLDPRSDYMSYWDTATGMCLLFTAFVTPFEVGVGIPTTINALFIINQMVNFIFILDIVAQFFIPVTDKSPENYGELVRNHKKIADNYLRGWFTLDAVSVLPLDLIIVADPDSLGGASNGALTKSVKLVRILRLVKLARVLRASRIIQRWENSISISYSKRSLTTSVALIMLLLHWFGCFWALLPQLQGNWRNATGLEPAIANCADDPDSCLWTNWADAQHEMGETCTGCVFSDPSTSALCSNPCLTRCERHVLAAMLGEKETYVRDTETWICRAVNDGLMTSRYAEFPFTVWITSCLVAMLQLVGGVAGVSPTNIVEYVVFVVAVLAGTLAFAGIQGVIVQVMTTGDPDEILFRQSMDALNFMMHDQHLPFKNRVIVRDYFRRSKKLMKRKSYYELIDRSLSRGLRADVRFLISNNLFSHVWWLNACEREFLEDLSVYIERESFSAGERIPSGPDVLNILMQGVATRGGAIIAVGGNWGDIILTSRILRDTREAKALGYCEVAKLSREGLQLTCKGYPKSARKIREAALKVAVARAMMVISMYSRMLKSKQHRRRTMERERAERAAELAVEMYQLQQQQQAMSAAYGMPMHPYAPPGMPPAHAGHSGVQQDTPGSTHTTLASLATSSSASNVPYPPWPNPAPPWVPMGGAGPGMPPPHVMMQGLGHGGAPPPWMMMPHPPMPMDYPQWGRLNPLPGFENVEPVEVEEPEIEETPAEILKKMKKQIEQEIQAHMVEPSFDLSDVLKDGPTLKDSENENRVVVRATKQSLKAGGGQGGGGGGAHFMGPEVEKKIAELSEKQDAATATLERLETKLGRLDTLAEAVAGINLTLRRAAEGNRRSAAYQPQRTPMRLPGQPRPRPSPPSGGDNAYAA